MTDFTVLLLSLKIINWVNQNNDELRIRWFIKTADVIDVRNC